MDFDGLAQPLVRLGSKASLKKLKGLASYVFILCMVSQTSNAPFGALSNFNIGMSHQRFKQLITSSFKFCKNVPSCARVFGF